MKKIKSILLVCLLLFSTFAFSKITFEELAKSVPADQGIGRWRDVEIPFKVAKPIQNPFQVFAEIDPKTNEEITHILNEKESVIQTAGIH